MIASACGNTPATAPDDAVVEEETSIDDDPIADEEGKADSVTKVVVVKGTVQNGSSPQGTLPPGTYWAWKFRGIAGMSATAVASTTTASRRPVVMIYGPRSGSDWGKRLGRNTASGATARTSVNIDAGGTYLVVIAESARRSHAFSLSFSTAMNACTLGGGTCRPLGPGGCPSGQHIASAASYPCGPSGTLGVMCCMPGEASVCEAEGGQCKALVPNACGSDAHSVDADTYPCGPPGVTGVQCCMPLCRPYCGAAGSRSEGWYDGCTGALIGWTHCAGQTATCGAVGTRSEGWYAPGGSLIRWADCG